MERPGAHLLAAYAALLTLAALVAFAAPPASAPAPTAAKLDERLRTHWAYQPLKAATPPAVPGDSQAHPVDAFILAKLAEAGLRMRPPADRNTLIRRVYYDLWGLPPTPQEVEAFVADPRPDAYERLIDALLASHHYGERWGRHWLDVARQNPGRIKLPHAPTAKGDARYRDYVVRAFNDDLPYDQFIREQLAGDLLIAKSASNAGDPAGPGQADPRYFDKLCAPAFLSIGPWFEECTNPQRLRMDMVDEMSAVASSAFMGLSMGCARCHDHKFDPIASEDYYALAGVFRSTRVVDVFSDFWRDGRKRMLRPMLSPQLERQRERNLAILQETRAKRFALLAKEHASLKTAWDQQAPAYRAAAGAVTAPLSRRWSAAEHAGQVGLRVADETHDGRKIEVIEWRDGVESSVKWKVEAGPEPEVWTAEVLLGNGAGRPIAMTVRVNGQPLREPAIAPDTGGYDAAHRAWVRLPEFEMRAGLNTLQLEAKGGVFPTLELVRMHVKSPAFASAVEQAAASTGLDAQRLAAFVAHPEEPWPRAALVGPLLPARAAEELGRLDAAIEEARRAAGAPELVIAVAEEAAPMDLPVHRRGDPHAPDGDPVPRGVPGLFTHLLPSPEIPPGESGRLQFAQWLADPRHPLTARVMANRVWHGHFGQGLVGTASDFGVRADAPSHPELLDELAIRFMKGGWSIKSLHRLIMTSRAYRQSSASDPLGQAKDPQARLLWRYPPRRLDAEALYDAMACSIGKVRAGPGLPLGDVRDTGGVKSLDKTAWIPLDQDGPRTPERGMYVLSTGRSPPGLGGDIRQMFALFDMDITGEPQPSRQRSTTAGQALFWMNNPLVRYHAEQLAKRLLAESLADDASRIRKLHMLVFARPPSAVDQASAQAYLAAELAAGRPVQASWAALCQACYAANRFRYVD